MDEKWTSTGFTGFSENGPIPESSDWDFGIGSVTGYRWWWWHVNPYFAGFENEEYAARSQQFSYLIGAYRGEWEDGRLEAACKVNGTGSLFFDAERKDHVVPANGCGCGFWAYFRQDLQMAEVLFNSDTRPRVVQEAYMGVDTVKVPILGVVEGTGRTVIGEKGFRSQHAKIKALCLPVEAQEVLSYRSKQVPSDSYVFGDQQLSGNTAFRDALMGATKAFRWESRKMEAAADFVTRLTTAEGILAELYPEAKILPDSASMFKQYPPDAFYGDNQ